MAFTHLIADVRTGRMVAPIVPASHTYSRVLNDSASSDTTTFRYVDEPVAQWRDLTSFWRRKVVTCWNGVPIYEGIIVKAEDNFDGTITATHVDFRTMMQMRTTLGEDGYTRQNYTGDYQLYSNRNIIALLLRLALEGPTPNFNLPLVFPFVDPLNTGNGPTAHDGVASRTYYDYEGPVLSEKIDELMNAAGGPDVDFQPTLLPGDVYGTTVRIGSTSTPQLTGPQFEFNLSAPKSGLFDVSLTEDATQMVSDVTYMGQGTGLIRFYGTAREAWDGPALQKIVVDTDLKSDDLARDHAVAYLSAHRNPTSQWSMSLMAGDPVNLADMVLGSRIRLFRSVSRGLVTSGTYNLRVIGYSGDLSNKVKLAVQPF